MSERDDVDLIATVLDHPNLYMGGPSDRSKRTAERILRALSEAGRTYEQGVKDGRRIVREDAQNRERALRLRVGNLSAQLAQAREALAMMLHHYTHGSDSIKESHEVVAYVRTTLAALTAGSTEGKDG